MYRSLLVPLDGSKFGEHALPLALGIAQRARATVQLLHVHPPLAAAYAEGHLFIDGSLDLEFKERQRTYLERLVQRLEKVSPVRVTTTVLDGEVAPTIRSAAESTGASLVVMTTHGRGALARLWLGSVADELVRELSMPLLLVRPGETPPDLANPPALKHVLLPLDGTPLAEQMIEPAVALGGLTGAEYTLLRVIKPVMPVSYPLHGASLGEEARLLLDRMETMYGQLRQEARDYLEGVADGLRARGLKVQTQVAVEMQPAVAILTEAGARGADLIALETHGRRGLARLFLGSVADKVLRGAAVPLLVHRPVHP